MSEHCEHAGCGFDNRLEYCGVEAANPEGAASVVLEYIDEILYQQACSQQDNCYFKSERFEHSFNRNFSYVLPTESPVGYQWLERQIAISHRSNSLSSADYYMVDVAWRVSGQSYEEDCFRTSYFIDLYPRGGVQAVLEQPNVITGKYETRKMTEYDYGQLFNELMGMQDAFFIEHDDDAAGL